MRILITLLTLFLAGCVGVSGKAPEPAHFDFGAMPAGKMPPVGVIAVDVEAPSWLAGGGIQYRLAHVDATRRFEYAESRWAAPPGELLERSLEARLTGSGLGRCRLVVDLDEFIQIFESQSASRWQLLARGTLRSGKVVVSHRSFATTAGAPSADAKGGVAAAAAAVAELGEQMAEWVAQTAKCRLEGS